MPFPISFINIEKGGKGPRNRGMVCKTLLTRFTFCWDYVTMFKLWFKSSPEPTWFWVVMILLGFRFYCSILTAFKIWSVVINRAAARRLPDPVDAVEALWMMKFNVNNANQPVILQLTSSAMHVPFARKVVRFAVGFLIPGSMPNQSWSWFHLAHRPWVVGPKYLSQHARLGYFYDRGTYKQNLYSTEVRKNRVWNSSLCQKNAVRMVISLYCVCL